MNKAKKTEMIINCILGALSIALAIFMFTYEYHALGAYAQTLPQEERMGFATAAIILFILCYVGGGFGAFVLAFFLFGLTWKLHKARNDEQIGEFIQTNKRINVKNRTLIVLIILKAVAVLFSVMFVLVETDAAHATVLSKTVYCVALAMYLGSLIFTLINRKKIAESAMETKIENTK